MSVFGRRPNPEAVARQLIKGLESGTLVFTPAVEPTAEEAVAEVLRLDAEFAAEIDRYAPGYRSVHPAITPELLARITQNRPEGLPPLLAAMRGRVAEAKGIEDETWREFALLGALLMLASTTLATVVLLAYLWLGSAVAVVGCAICGALIGALVFGPVLGRAVRNAAGARLTWVLAARSELAKLATC